MITLRSKRSSFGAIANAFRQRQQIVDLSPQISLPYKSGSFMQWVWPFYDPRE